MKSRALALALAAGSIAAASSVANAQFYVASGLPLSIADHVVTTSDITVPAGAPTITGTTVVFRATHTWNADLDILLIHNGSYLVLSTDNGGGGDNYQNVRFSDAASASITTATTAGNINGTYRPEGTTGTFATQGLGDAPESAYLGGIGIAESAAVTALGFWNGTSAEGTWTLFVGDDAGADIGTVDYWSIEFNGVEDPSGPGLPPPPPPAFSGSFTSTPLSLTLGTSVINTTVFTSPAANPGLTDGSGENANASLYSVTTLEELGNEVGYKVDHAGGPARFDLTGLSTDLDLVILDSSGTPAGALAGSFGVTNEKVEFADLPAGTYYAVVDTYGAANNGSGFTLLYSQPAPPPTFSGNFTDTPNELIVNVAQNGTTIWDSGLPQAGLSDGAGEAANGTGYTSGDADDAGNEVAYRVNHPGGPARFDLTGLGQDLNLYLLGASGVPSSNQAQSENTGTVAERITYADLPAGTYYAVVDTATSAVNGSAYGIKYTIPAPSFTGDFTSTPNSIACGGSADGTTIFDPTSPQPGMTVGAGEPANGTGYLGTGLAEPGNEVAYRITHGGGDFTANLTGLTADIDLFLIDSSGMPGGSLARSTFGGTAAEVITMTDLPAGTYYLVVDTYTTAAAGSPYNLAWASSVCPPTCPCAADFDGSGGTPDTTDITAFFDGWLAGDPSADVDCSGGTPDTTDITQFFVEWLAGGC